MIRFRGAEGRVALFRLLSGDTTYRRSIPAAIDLGVDIRTAVGNRAQFPAMVDAIERRRLDPEINRVFAFNAHRHPPPAPIDGEGRHRHH